MALQNPTALTSATQFRPGHLRAHSRSPSRSPVRKARFTAQHLDPLLSNLSPDSTLRALQATDTIPGGSREETLAKSIADTSPAEREVGIRAAFAAQKLREWRIEISNWPWPNRQERGLGMGFLLPHGEHQKSPNRAKAVYLGCLTLQQVDRYEDRLDELRDELESLEMESIKDHVLASHSSPSSATTPNPRPSKYESKPGGYGRMRDFTALITATVIQALPDLAIVSMLIDVWHIRLDVLRQLPFMLEMLDTTKRNVNDALVSLGDRGMDSQLGIREYELIHTKLDHRITDLAHRIDNLLDLLEGQEDALPQEWIDSLENIELQFAEWKDEVQRIAEKNDTGEMPYSRTDPASFSTASVQDRSSAPPLSRNPGSIHDMVTSPRLIAAIPERPGSQDLISPVENTTTTGDGFASREAHDLVSPIGSGAEHAFSRTKPPLKLDHPQPQGHRREISEVSIADSTLSELSRAEVVDARSTEVMASPRISVVDHQLPVSPTTLSADSSRPPLLQRASTASIEVIQKDQLRKVDLRRSMSADLLTKISESHSPESTPSKALQQLSGRPRRGTTPVAELEDPTTGIYSDMPPSQFQVQPLHVRSREDREQLESPSLPRKSSKRASWGPSTSLTPMTTFDSVSDATTTPQRSPPQAHSPSKRSDHEDSLEDKIRDILSTLPTRIKLSRDHDSPEATGESSNTSTRASTPTPALTLLAVKTSRKSSATDTGVRVFHLTPNSQSRDAQPIKLFVRTVGENGERVMVRVGGGWADLGEYLREYSAHHGRRNVGNGKMEVAQYPGKVQNEAPLASTGATSVKQPTMFDKGVRKRGSSASQLVFDEATEQWNRGHHRGQSRSPSPPPQEDAQEQAWVPPPVPPIPLSYTMQAPTIMSSSSSSGDVLSGLDGYERMNKVYGVEDGSHALPRTRKTTIHMPGISTSTTISNPQSNSSKYTPLGAAGPKTANRRAVTLNSATSAGNEAWVQGMVGKARAVSGPHTTTTHGPTTTTTTTMTSSSPSSRRTSAMLPGPRPDNTRISTMSTGPAPGSNRVSTIGTSHTSDSNRNSTILAAPANNSNRNSTIVASPPPMSARHSMLSSPISSNSSDLTALPDHVNHSNRNSIISPSPMTVSRNTSEAGSSNAGSAMGRRKSRSSLGDFSGIKRVFLRKKSERV